VGMHACTHRCDNITISPALLSELEASEEPLARLLSPAGSVDASLARLAMNRPTFDAMHGADAVRWFLCGCVA
jgi:transaldolase